jgi:hypothetical protein
MNRWDEYLALTAELDDVRREAAATIAAQQSASDDAATELSGVRQRIALQRGRLTEVANGVTRAAPQVEPLAAERSAAVATLTAADAGSAPDVRAALQEARAALDIADATLTAATTPNARRGPLADRPPGVRAMIVYGWFALLSLVALVEMNSIVGSSLQAAVVIAVFAVLVPASGWTLGWLSLFLLFGRATTGPSVSVVAGAPGPRRASGALLGALLCAVPLVVGLILAAV